MPTSSSAATVEKKKSIKLLNQKSVDQNEQRNEKQNPQEERNLLKIAPALPSNNKRSLYVRSHSTLNASSVSKARDIGGYDFVILHPSSDGYIRVSRTQNEKEKQPDRICLDRRGLTKVPVIEVEPKLRLLSLQHNLISDLDSFSKQKFPTLVLLDMYDNQLEQIKCLDLLENIRVLLMGKNRIKKIEGLEHLKKLEVLDLHGNLIGSIGGLSNLSELKVLNLAGNQIRIIGSKDLQGLKSLQELNLRRNRLKKLLGFADIPNLSKLFLSNNDLLSVEDISNIAKSPSIKEICIDNNPVSLAGDCVSFLVSYLPSLTKLNMMQITEQVRKAAMAWRRNKEITNAAFMDLTSETSMNCRREEVISNARTNWELLRSQTKCLTNNVNTVDKSLKNLKPDSDFILTSLIKPNDQKLPKPANKKLISKVPLLPDKKISLIKSPSQETESSQNTSNGSSSNTSSSELLKLPPILVPIINKLEQNDGSKENGVKLSGSLSSIGPNVDSSISSLASSEAVHSSSSSSASEGSDLECDVPDIKIQENVEENNEGQNVIEKVLQQTESPSTNCQNMSPSKDCNSNNTEDSSSNISSNINTSTNTNISTSLLTVPAASESENVSVKSNASTRSIKSAIGGKSVLSKNNAPRASTAKAKKSASPLLPKDREQGGDYLIEICGRHLNVYGQGALRFIDRPWNSAKANDVTTIKFNYVNFNSTMNVLSKIKHRFPNADHFVFKETNISCIGQLNALAEVQGLVSLFIDPEGNSICDKDWQNYAVYRLAHWGLRIINGKEIADEGIKKADEEFQSLSDIILWSLPDGLLQPLLNRLRIDVNHGVTEQNAKKWLLRADPELRKVVSKEALQWKKGSVSQDDVAMRQKAKQYISGLLDETTNAMNKLRILDQEWPSVMHEFVQNTLLDYSQLDMYMKQKIQELNK